MHDHVERELEWFTSGEYILSVKENTKEKVGLQIKLTRYSTVPGRSTFTFEKTVTCKEKKENRAIIRKRRRERSTAGTTAGNIPEKTTDSERL